MMHVVDSKGGQVRRSQKHLTFKTFPPQRERPREPLTHLANSGELESEKVRQRRVLNRGRQLPNRGLIGGLGHAVNGPGQ